jgi:hypothetical protein
LEGLRAGIEKAGGDCEVESVDEKDLVEDVGEGRRWRKWIGSS